MIYCVIVILSTENLHYHLIKRLQLITHPRNRGGVIFSVQFVCRCVWWRSSSNVKVKYHRRGGVCILLKLLVWSHLKIYHHSTHFKLMLNRCSFILFKKCLVLAYYDCIAPCMARIPLQILVLYEHNHAILVWILQTTHGVLF